MSPQVDVIIKPAPRQVLVIAERDRLIGFCLACRVRRPEGKIANLRSGFADGSLLTESQFGAARAEADSAWREGYPEAEVVYLRCPAAVHPQQFARLEAERRVSA